MSLRDAGLVTKPCTVIAQMLFEFVADLLTLNTLESKVRETLRHGRLI